ELRQTVNGLTVGVERAYMDAAQVIIGVTTDGYHYARADLRVDGRDASGGAVLGMPTTNGSAAGVVFNTPQNVGGQASAVLEISGLYGPGLYPTTVEGPWTFAFDLPNAGGETWTGTASDVASGVTLTLDRLSVSPTLITGSLTWTGGPLGRSSDDAWS